MTGRNIEIRASAEIRAAGRRLEGYAALFNVETRIGSFTEIIAPGAFRMGDDTLALMDHDPGKVLGRTRSGTLRLSQDSKGLAYSLDLPDTTFGRDVLALAERSDLGGMSFGFLVSKGGDVWQGDRRTLQQVDLKEISVVSSFAAYPDTTIALRSLRHNVEAERRRRALILARIVK